MRSRCPETRELLSSLVPNLDPEDPCARSASDRHYPASDCINDLGFSAIIEACATNINLTTRCFPDTFSDRLWRLRERYESVGQVLRERFPAADVYIADYPAEVFNGGACGALGRPNIGIDGTARRMRWPFMARSSRRRSSAQR